MPLENHHGGFAYLATLIRRERAHCADCILLNAGDVAQGTPVSTIFHGLPVFQIANMLGFDAATLGNHDFDYGWPQARKFIETANYPMVSSNVVGSGGQLGHHPPKRGVGLHLRVDQVGEDLPTTGQDRHRALVAARLDAEDQRQWSAYPSPEGPASRRRPRTGVSIRSRLASYAWRKRGA